MLLFVPANQAKWKIIYECCVNKRIYQLKQIRTLSPQYKTYNQNESIALSILY